MNIFFSAHGTNFFSLSAFLILSGRSAHDLSAYDQTVLRRGGRGEEDPATLKPSATRGGKEF
jgi:hypothetical protein